MARTRKRPLPSDTLSAKYGGGHFIKSGKWTPDEEMMADKLIYAFQTGTLSDCAEGTTLRAYLARKLNCAPMRISKKFAGLCIGKHTYVTNNTADKEMCMWHKPVARMARASPRPRPTRYRPSPEFDYDQDDDSSSSDDDSSQRMLACEEDEDEEGTSEEEYSPSPSVWKKTRERLSVQQPAARPGLRSSDPPRPCVFAPIAAHPLSVGSPRTPPAHQSLSGLVKEESHSAPMELLDFEEVYQQSYTSSPHLGGSGMQIEAGEEQQWREVLTSLFGETDSSSSVSHIFRRDTVGPSSSYLRTSSAFLYK